MHPLLNTFYPMVCTLSFKYLRSSCYAASYFLSSRSTYVYSIVLCTIGRHRKAI